MKDLSRFWIVTICTISALSIVSCAPGGLQTRKNTGSATATGKGHSVQDYSEESSTFDEYDRYEGKAQAEDDLESAAASQEKFYQKGLASWYGREFQGKETASGEKFDMYKFTAAHKTLPFGTVVKVKNIENGKIVNVRITDRGPYKGNRILDLSYAAAKELGILSQGSSMVGLIIAGDKHRNASPESENLVFDEQNVEPVVDDTVSINNYNGDTGSESGYALQVGAFYSRKNADMQKERVQKLTNSPAVVVRDGDLYKVRIDNLNTRMESEKFKKILESENIPSYTTQKQMR